jgi:DNA-binding NarL/FixJ family response regulator
MSARRRPQEPPLDSRGVAVNIPLDDNIQVAIQNELGTFVKSAKELAETYKAALHDAMQALEQQRQRIKEQDERIERQDVEIVKLKLDLVRIRTKNWTAEEGYREVMALRAEGLSISQIAGRLGVPERTVKSRITRHNKMKRSR